jgi:hypothetical protein
MRAIRQGRTRGIDRPLRQPGTAPIDPELSAVIAAHIFVEGEPVED